MVKARQHKDTDIWKAAYASVTGVGHEQSGVVCQDAAAIATSRNGALAACVCDGAGSARFADIGAKAVVRKISQYLIDNEKLLISGDASPAEIINTALFAIEEQAKLNGGIPKDYACTIVAILVSKEKAVTVHLGDGVIASVVQGLPIVLSPPENGEFKNEVVLVTSAKAKQKLRIQVIELSPFLTSFALMTDGSQESLYERRTNSVSQVVEQMAGWLDQNDPEEVGHGIEAIIKKHFTQRTNDDCTVLVIRRQNTFHRFACPDCGRWALRRNRTKKHSYEATCDICSGVLEFPGKSKRAYPLDVREWVRHLAIRMRMDLPKVREVTGIPTRTLRRWLAANKAAAPSPKLIKKEKSRRDVRKKTSE
jgi:serine/threonine protein phosphatase PrpC